MKKRNYFDLLKPEIISGIKNLELIARYVVEGFISGLHRSPFHGFSVEFSENRQYVKGDDIKYIDWKLYGRSNRYYIKRFMEETNLICNILCDVSNSMNFKSAGKVTKIEYAYYLTSALAYLLINQQDMVSLTLFNNDIYKYIPPSSKRNHLIDILKIMEQTNPAGSTNIGDRLNQISAKTKKRGLIILISDLLEEPEKIIDGLRRLRYKNNDIIIFHILDEDEISLNFKGKIKFRDLETNEELITMPQYIKSDYQAAFKENIEKINKESKGLVIDYQLIKTNESLAVALKYFLKKRL